LRIACGTTVRRLSCETGIFTRQRSSTVATYRDKHQGCTIEVSTQRVGDPMLRLFQVHSIVIKCEGRNIQYPSPRYESQAEGNMVAKAIAHAKVYIENRPG
jgi:hypothetical protein